MENDEFKDALDVTYLGARYDINNPTAIREKIYSMPIQIQGREIIAYISVKNAERYHNASRDVFVPTVSVLGWYDLSDPVCGDTFDRVDYPHYYSSSKEQMQFVHDDTEPEKQIRFLDVQFPIPSSYIPGENETEFDQRFKSICIEIGNKLFQMKKQFIVGKRAEQLKNKLSELESKKPELSLQNVLAELYEEEREKAQDLYERMILCIKLGKYSFSDYETFISHLPEMVRRKGIFISGREEDSFFKKSSAFTTRTFMPTSNKSIAGIYPEPFDRKSPENMQRYRDRILDINQSFDSLDFNQLDPLIDGDASHYRDNEIGGNIVSSFARLGKLIVCTGDKDELTLIPQESQIRYKVKEEDQR